MSNLPADESRKMEAEARAWIEAMLGEPLGGETLQQALKSGVAMCNLVNAIEPGCCAPPSRLFAPFKQMENIGNYLRACETALGVPVHDSFQTVALFENSNFDAVLIQIHSVGRVAQRRGFQGPTLGAKLATATPRAYGKDARAMGRGGEQTFIGGGGMHGQINVGAEFDTARPGFASSHVNRLNPNLGPQHFKALGATPLEVTMKGATIGGGSTLGCHWEFLSTERPARGNEIENEDLGAALLQKVKKSQPTEFDEYELAALRVKGLTADSFVKVGATRWFQIAGADLGSAQEAAAPPASAAGGASATEAAPTNPPTASASASTAVKPPKAKVEKTPEPEKPVLHEGFLTKDPMHGHLLSSARRRFFVLHEQELVWYEDDAKKEKKGNLALVGAKVARKKSEAGAPGDELVVTSSFNDVLVLRGEGLDAWEKAITVEVAVGLS